MKRFGKGAGSVLAIAAFGTMGAAHGYEWQVNEDTMLGFGGDIELAYVMQDTGNDHNRELTDNGSEIDFFGEHAFTDTVSAYFMAQFEFSFDEAGFDSDPAADESTIEADDVYLGVRGNFGAVQVGDWDGIYDNNVEDLLDIFEVAGPTSADQIPSGDSIAYFSPSFSGFSFAVQGFFKGDDGSGIDSADNGQAFQAVIKYEADMFGLYAGYAGNGLDDDQDGTIGVGASVDLAPVTVAARFETVGDDSTPGGAIDNGLYDAEGFTNYGVAVSYDYGPGAITGVVNQVEPEDENLDSRTEFGANVNYEIDDNLYVYVEHYRVDQDDDAGNITATGLVYSF